MQQQGPHTPTKQPSVGVSVVSHQLPPNKQVVRLTEMQQKAVQQKQIPDASMKQQQQPPPLIGKQVVLPPHHSPHMLTGAVASPPLKQMHMTSQQPIGQGKFGVHFASFRNLIEVILGARTAPPPMSSPQGQQRAHIQQQSLTVPPYDMNMVSFVSDFFSLNFSTNQIEFEWTQLETMGKYNSICSQSPPPAHQQTSPVNFVTNFFFCW